MHLVPKSLESMTIVAEVVERAREECSGRDCAGHHGDVIVRDNFLWCRSRAFVVLEVVHEVFAVGPQL